MKMHQPQTNSLILKLNTSNTAQYSKENIKIRKIVSSISPANFIELVKYADNKVNPRNATVNKITKAIHETLDVSPELLWLKTKGILLATKKCEELERNRVRISLDDHDYEGIMDGGHNTFAIALYILEILFEDKKLKIKKWEECKKFWDSNFKEIQKRFEENEELFQFSIPIEIITPTSEDNSDTQYYDYLSEICSARNNNIQLKDTAKGYKDGFYDVLEELLKDFPIIWKTGEKGRIRSEDVISMATLPFIFLKESAKQEEIVPLSLNKISIYSQKSKCVDFFNTVISSDKVSKEVKGKKILEHITVKSALKLTEDILLFFDKIFLEFPDLYKKPTPGKFGGISAVSIKDCDVPFLTTQKKSKYRYPLGFIYPLVTGVTSLMKYDEVSKEVKWITNPNQIDLSNLELAQYVELIKMINFDSNKIGKGAAFYNEAETIFERIVNKIQ